jgi:hypothetical protein
MSGLLHIFRTHPDVYQLDYTLGTMSYARTCTREQLEHLLVTPAAFDEILISQIFDELSAHNNVTVTEVDIPEEETNSLGFEPMPSDA